MIWQQVAIDLMPLALAGCTPRPCGGAERLQAESGPGRAPIGVIRRRLAYIGRRTCSLIFDCLSEITNGFDAGPLGADGDLRLASAAIVAWLRPWRGPRW
jgi:hypothetical protein